MKTIKDVSFELKVSTTTVYNHIDKIKGIDKHIFKIKNVTHLDEEAIRQLKISLGQIEVPTVEENFSYEDVIKDISESIAKDIKDSNEDMRAELEEVKKQNKILIDMMQNKKNKTLLDKFKDLFKYE